MGLHERNGDGFESPVGSKHRMDVDLEDDAAAFESQIDPTKLQPEGSRGQDGQAEKVSRKCVIGNDGGNGPLQLVARCFRICLDVLAHPQHPIAEHVDAELVTQTLAVEVQRVARHEPVLS